MKHRFVIRGGGPSVIKENEELREKNKFLEELLEVRGKSRCDSSSFNTKKPDSREEDEKRVGSIVGRSRESGFAGKE